VSDVDEGVQSGASHGDETFPHAAIARSPLIRPCRCIDPVREDHRINHFTAIETTPSLERQPPRIVSEIDK
jgi:hypothetical protein